MKQVDPRRKLSVTVITLNEEKNIARCLDSVTWADEIVVIDAGSSDRTVEIAKKYTDKVIHHDWPGPGIQKNYAVDQATHDWIFNLDADERVTEALREEILEVLHSEAPLSGYSVPRKNFFAGRWIRYAGWYPDYTLRLFDRRRGRFNERIAHESVHLEGKKAFLQHPIEHNSYPSLATFYQKMGPYALLSARQARMEGRRFRVVDLMLRPLFTFLKLYFFRQGFREGVDGILIAAFYSYYTFLKYANLRELERHPSDEA